MRLRDASRRLAERERQIAVFLKLRVRPNLALLDEESARYVIRSERRALDAEGDSHEQETVRGDAAERPPDDSTPPR